MQALIARRRLLRGLRVGLWPLLMLTTAGAAFGFADPIQFAARATTHAATVSASSEGLSFTGAPRLAGLTCSACHTGAPGQVELKIGADPTSLFSAYAPGQTYALEIELLGATRGEQWLGPAHCTEPPTRSDHLDYVQCDNNGFALEIDDRGGPLQGFCAAPPVGGICPEPNPYGDEVVVGPAADVVFGARSHDPTSPKTVLRNGPTRWHLWWTAPPAGSGRLKLFAAAVDGNGGRGTALADQDPEGDDVVAATLTLGEGGAQTRGCAMGAAGRPMPAGGALLLVAVWLYRRTSRRRTR